MAEPRTSTILEPDVPAKNAGTETQDATVDLNRLKRFFQEFQTLTTEARKESATDIDYYDSKQWSATELAALAKRNQPDLVINRIKPAINGIIGVVARGKSDPKAWPRGPDDTDSADVATDVLRYVADYNRLARMKQDCILDMLVPGTMAAIVEVDAELQVKVNQVRFEEFFYDPRARRRDFKDARYLGVAKWAYVDEAAAQWPGKVDPDMIPGPSAAGVIGLADMTFSDRPGASNMAWFDRKQRRLMIVEIYYRDTTWKRCVFHGAGILEEGDSPYLDHLGKPHCPIEAQSAYVDRDNNRYGAVRDMRGPQDEINKRRSKALHLLSVRQLQPIDAMTIDTDKDEARIEAAKPDGVIPLGYQVVPTNDMVSGQLELLQEAKAEIERMGPNPAILGRDGNDQSGRALLARQQSGLVELANLYAGMDDWELRLFRQIWARVKQFWKAPQFIRVTDDDNAPKFVGINQPVHETVPVIDPATGQPAMHPQTGEALTQTPRYPTQDPDNPNVVRLQPKVLGYKNSVGEMDVDIEVDTVQDVGTIAQEQFSDLMQMMSSNPVWGQQVPLEVMIGLSSIPHKREVLDKIKAARQEAMSAAAEQQKQTQSVEMATAASKIEETKSKTDLNTARARALSLDALSDAHTAHAGPIISSFHAGVDSGMAAQSPAAGAGPVDPSGVQGVSPAS